MFYENYLEQEPELMFEENQEVEEFEDDYYTHDGSRVEISNSHD